MKSSLLSLALFLFLFAFASKPSLASRHEPSLLSLPTDGDNNFVSAITEFVEDGLNLIMSKSDCPNQNSWPDLVGERGKVAAEFIEKQNPCLNVYICPASRGPCYTKDLRLDRVRVWVNLAGYVAKVPVIG